MQKKDFLLTYLPYFFSDRYRKQTIYFFRPYCLYLPSSSANDIFFLQPELSGRVESSVVHRIIVSLGQKLHRSIFPEGKQNN